jgi:hypothetical protein
MTEAKPEPHLRSLGAEALRIGHRFLTRDGQLSAAVASVGVEVDDLGSPALVVATLDDGTKVRIAVGSTVRIETGEDDGVFGEAADVVTASPAQPPRIPAAAAVIPPGLIPADAGTPEAIVAKAAAAYPANQKIQRLATRLGRGLNLKSGAKLKDVRDLANTIFVQHADETTALMVAGLITELPYDGNPGRWNPIESCLALASYIVRIQGDSALTRRYADLLRAPDRDEKDAFKAKVAAVVRQRSLNEPNFYDKEIAKAQAAVDRKAELDWRALRLDTLLQLLAHGGSETFDDTELERRISNELTEIRSRGPV